MVSKKFLSASAAVLLAASWCLADIYTGEPSNRVEINMGVTPWLFLKSDPSGGCQATNYADAGWTTVGIPHTWNDDDEYTNYISGGSPWGGGLLVSQAFHPG